MSPDDSEYITESGGLLAIPSCLSDRNTAIGIQFLPKECHEAVEAKEQWSRAIERSIRPLALRLDAQMGMSLLKGHFQAPARNFVADDLFRITSPGI